MTTTGALRVALYVCRPAPAFAMASLTHYALARGRIVDIRLTDCANPLLTARQFRPVWRNTLAPLLESGTVRGLVVPSEKELADTRHERNELHAWLGSLGVELDCMYRPAHVPPTGLTT